MKEIIILFIPLMVLLVFAIIYFILVIRVLKLRKKTQEKIELYSYNSYIPPTFAIEKLLQYTGMKDIFAFFYYTLNIGSFTMSATVIAFAARKDNEYTDFIILFSVIALIFTVINFIINPKKYIDVCQHNKRQLENTIRETAYDEKKDKSKKNAEITKKVNELNEYYYKKLY